MPSLLRSLIYPPGFTRFHRTVSAAVLALYLGAVALWYSITDDPSPGATAFKLAFVITQWCIFRLFLVLRAESSEAGRQAAADYSWAD